MTQQELARLIDHTNVRAYATQIDIAELCDEAGKYGFWCVTVNPAWTTYCAKRLRDSKTGVDTTIGFPLGASTAHVKLEEAREAERNGATEVDVVINIGALKSGFPDFVEKEIAAIVHAVPKLPVKVILETSFLNDDEKIAICEMSLRAGAAFIKTSTGYGRSGATVADIRLIRSVVGENMGIKAAGGIRDYTHAMALIDAGATRIGTSAAIKILSEIPA